MMYSRGHGEDFIRNYEDSLSNERYLAGGNYGKEEDSIDYSVLAVGVSTLAMLLLVEMIRHRLDHAAKGRPFFKRVLDGVYSELSILGVVEFVVYLILKYAKNIDKAKKEVFADVHFAFFYTAILYAIQSVIVALVTRKHSKRLWILPEELELHHYVEIREEFERVQTKFFPKDEIDGTSATGSSSLGKFFHRLIQNIRHPGLRARYLNLLIQVKFHQLRIHFLEGNNLPTTLKVSEYLKRSETRVLMKLVHVSSGAWLMLTGGLSLIYVLMGIVAYVTEDKSVVGSFMSCIFFSMLVVFILIGLTLYFKMRNTFQSILSMKGIKTSNTVRREEGVDAQLKLFWFKEPQVVISIIQFMQFGYALALAIVMMYWESLKGAMDIRPYWYLAAVLGCYGIFVYVLSKVLPQFTLCTSLGYLVNQKNLQETVALHRLNEAHRLQLRKRAMLEFECDTSTILFEMDDDSGNLLEDRDSVASGSNSNRSRRKTEMLAALVKSDTATLRNLLPQESRDSLRDSENRRNRRKTVSDGVALMRQMGKAAAAFSESTMSSLTEALPLPVAKKDPVRALDDTDVLRRDREARAKRRENRRKTVSASNVIRSWQDISKAEKKIGDVLGSVEVSNSKMEHPSSKMEQRAARIAQRRQNRKKVKSESAIIQGWHDISAPPTNELTQYRTLSSLDESKPFQVETLMQSERSFSNYGGKGDVSTLGLSIEDSDDELSDVDIKEWERGSAAQSEKEETSCLTRICENLSPNGVIGTFRNYFMSEHYSTFSHVFGSVFAIFLVGNRIEVMLASTGVLESSENTWELSLGISFWLETSCYITFIVAGSLVLLLFLPLKHKSSKQRMVIFASVLDILLSGACIAILFLAEAQRCCEDEGDRNVGDECCPSWGSRTYGGLGDIEPFTSLIGLRIFRFYFGGALVKCFDNKEGISGVYIDKAEEGVTNQETDDKNERGSMQAEIGTPLELWEKAISKYPEVVKEYGQFSGELFQCMLGLEIIEDTSPKMKESLNLSPQSPIGGEEERVPRQGRRQSMKLGKKYEMLPAQAQSMIIAGKLGKPVRSTKITRSSSGVDLFSLAEESDGDLFDSSSQAPGLGAPVFQIDDTQLALEEQLESKLFAPNARLLRSMRRCDRRFLPILKKWICVDVVMTQFEIVYFEAVDLKDPSTLSHQENASLIALKATGGGKGLRLQDVAAGRKIVGHLNLSEISEVHVERSMPVSDPNLEECDALYEEDIELPVEYWSKKSKTKQENRLSRQLRWEKTKEDRLTLVSMHGRLIIRFYSDLEDVELHESMSLTENEDSGPIRKNIAFQWAQTISHCCGRGQLRQNLPHHGTNDSDEIRDFLEVVNYHEKEHEDELKQLKNLGIFSPNNNKSTERIQSLMLNDDSVKRRSLKNRVGKRLNQFHLTSINLSGKGSLENLNDNDGDGDLKEELRDGGDDELFSV